jgi:hypothetical protein
MAFNSIPTLPVKQLSDSRRLHTVIEVVCSHFSSDFGLLLFLLVYPSVETLLKEER